MSFRRAGSPERGEPRLKPLRERPVIPPGRGLFLLTALRFYSIDWCTQTTKRSGRWSLAGQRRDRPASGRYILARQSSRPLRLLGDAVRHYKRPRGLLERLKAQQFVRSHMCHKLLALGGASLSPRSRSRISAISLARPRGLIVPSRLYCKNAT